MERLNAELLQSNKCEKIQLEKEMENKEKQIKLLVGKNKSLNMSNEYMGDKANNLLLSNWYLYCQVYMRDNQEKHSLEKSFGDINEKSQSTQTTCKIYNSVSKYMSSTVIVSRDGNNIAKRNE